MRFFTASAALLAMVASAFAQTADFDPILTPLRDQQVPAGAPFEVTWTAPANYRDGAVTISLIGGATQGTQIPIMDLASGIANSAEKWTWNVDATLGEAAVYGLVFKLESNTAIFQYSLPFHIKASAGAPSSSAYPTVSASVSASVSVSASTSDVANPTGSTIYLTQTHGTKTVTLTSCPPTTTSVPETTSTPLPPPVEKTSYVAPNTTVAVVPSSTLYTITKPTVPTTVPVPVSPSSSSVYLPPAVVTPVPTQPQQPAVTPSVVPVASAGRFVAGPVAAIAGIAMALLL